MLPPASTKLPTVPLLAVMSPAVKPKTASLNVTVTGIGEVLVGSDVAEVVETVGATVSIVTLSGDADVLKFPARSV